MKTLGTIGLVIIAAIAAWWVAHIVLGVVLGVLHYALFLAIFGGICYVAYALTSPNKALGWRRRILP